VNSISLSFLGGTVKKYLHDNCDYTFTTLTEKSAKSNGFHAAWHHTKMGTLHDLLDGGLLLWSQSQGCSNEGEGVQFKALCIPEAIAHQFDS
jgi:hypothetical protein